MSNEAQHENPQDDQNKKDPRAIWETSCHHFHRKRSLGAMPRGSYPRPIGSLELRAEKSLRKLINCGQRGCDQLLFNDDGSLLFVADSERKMCKLVDSKMKFVGDIEVGDSWRIKEMMNSGPNEVATSCISTTSNRAPCIKFWDVRKTRYEVASSVFNGRTSVMSSVYSKKDGLFLTFDKNAACDRLATFNRNGVLQDSSDVMPINLADSAKSIALSPDESILVMETLYHSYTIVRQLDLRMLFDDIRLFRAAFLVLSQDVPSYLDLYNESGLERIRTKQSRNALEIMYYKSDSVIRMCPCEQSTKSVSFSPRSDFFAGHKESFKDERYLYKIKRYPSRTVLTFDLLEHRMARRRSQDSRPEMYARYGRNNVNGRSYLNLPLCEMKVDTYYGRDGDPLRPPYWATPYEIPLLAYEQRSYCSIGAGKIAVTTHCNQPLVAVGDDRFKVQIYRLNDKLTPVQEFKIDVYGGLRRFAFSPRDSSIVVSDSARYLRWYDIEYKGPIVSEAMVSGGENDQWDWYTNLCAIFENPQHGNNLRSFNINGF